MIKIEIKEVQLVPVGEIKRNPKNRNKHPKEQIEELARHYAVHAMRTAIIVSNQSGLIVAGDGRFQAALLAKMPKVPVSFQDFESPEKEFAFGVADNGLSLWSELDIIGISQDAKDLPQNFNLADLGIKDFRIVEAEVFEAQCDENDIPEHVEPRTKLGDLYQIGRHRLLCGDSTNIQQVEKLLGGVMVDLVVTDPPYNVAVNDESAESLKARNRRTDGLKIANDKMSDEDFRDFLKAVFTNYFIVMGDGASIYVFYADSMTVPFMTTFTEAGFHFAQNCIWAKQQFVMTRKDYHYKHEPVMYGWKKGASHNWYADRKQSSVWSFDRPFKNELHPTMKPIDLIEYPIANSSNLGDAVLDLFGGSGSTLIACEKSNRKCFLMELDPHYCDVIVARWEKYTGQTAELISG